MAYTRLQLSGLVHEAKAGISRQQTPFVRLTLKQGEVRKGEHKTRWFTVFLPDTMFTDLASAQQCAARYSPGKHLLVEGRPEFKLWAPGAVTAPDLESLQQQVRQDIVLFANSAPEVLG